MTGRGQRIGVFGGSFDPVHAGHLVIGEIATHELSLDGLLFVPAWKAPHKSRDPKLSAGHRLRMVRLAVRGRKGWSVSDAEIRRGGVSYTVDTLRSIRRNEPEARLYLLVGSDNLATFHTWKEWREVVRIARIVVYERCTRKSADSLL